MDAVIFALWFLLPAGVANVAPIFAAVIPGLRQLDAPLDGGRKLGGKPILGPHKTWRGLISGIVLATLFILVEQATWGTPYGDHSAWLMGPLLAIGALGGDAVESFFKRRRGRASGEAWLIFDQIDYVLGALILTLPVIQLVWIDYLIIVAVWFLIHLVASYVGWLVGLKERPI